MSEIPKAYEPQSVEDKWYDFWLKQNCFTADPARVSPKRPAYSIVIPPPNVTGVLTMGHVLNNTIQDILARKARMDGKEVLWLPGTDHAGIATQTVVEKTLKKSGEIRHRDDLGREKFLERVWQWKEKHGGIIIQQLKKLGSFEFFQTSFSYIDKETGEERYVGVPEEGGRNVIASDPLEPGSVYAASVDDQGNRSILAGKYTLTLSGANTFTGQVYVNQGTLSINSTAALNSASFSRDQGREGYRL